MPKDLKNADYYDSYSVLLTKKQREVMEMYYFSDLSLTEIAQETDTTRQAVFNAIKNCEARLSELEASMQLTEKRKKAQKLLNTLKKQVKGNKEAEELVEEINRLFE